ncbi:MAG TPA: starch synthase, partial [Anaerolineae bacterium]|nr:starch synthase [Anaerolineae bacterium]
MSEKPLKILFLAAEAVPFAKVGGLADVAGSLPQAIRALGHDVRLMIPRYGSIRSDTFEFR